MGEKKKWEKRTRGKRMEKKKEKKKKEKDKWKENEGMRGEESSTESKFTVCEAVRGSEEDTLLEYFTWPDNLV